MANPLEQAEDVLQQIHKEAHRQSRPVSRKYPTLFLLLVTFSVAALFHGFDVFMDEFAIFDTYPLVLVLVGVLGLLVTGTLYKHLGKDKYES